MAQRNALAVWLGGAALVGLVMVDRWPALHGAPLLILVIGAGIQIGREVCVALSQRNFETSTTVVGTLVGVVLLHVAYLRSSDSSELLLLIGTIAVAMLALIVAAVVHADVKLHDWATALRDLLVMLLVTTVISVGCSAVLLLQYAPVWGQDGPELGTRVLAAVLATAWLAAGLGGLVSRRDPRGRREAPPEASAERSPDEPAPPGRTQPTVAGDLATVVAALALLPAAGAPLKFGATVLGPHLVVLGLLVGLGVVLGQRVLATLARACGVGTFRFPLPRQLHWLQPLYDRLYTGGLTDYAGSLVFVFALLYGYVRGVLA